MFFPQALGGTKKSPDLYCGACNRHLGTHVDAPFAKDFELATTVLNIKRDRDPPPPREVTTTDGMKIYIRPGGVVSPQGPTRPERDGEGNITFAVPIDRPDLFGHMLAMAAKDMDVAPDVLGEGLMSLTSAYYPIDNAKLGSVGPSSDRAVAKIALGFLALQIGDDVFAEHYTVPRLAAVQGTGTRAWLQPPFRDLVAPMLPPTDGVQHRVVIYTTECETWAHVEIYGTFGYAVLLAEVSDARFASPYIWGQNPTTGASGEGRALGTPLPVPVREQVVPSAEDIVGIFGAMRRISRETASLRIIKEEIGIAFARYEGKEISEFIDELAWRVAQRLTALRHPSFPLNLSLPIANRGELERILRALRTAAKK